MMMGQDCLASRLFRAPFLAAYEKCYPKQSPASNHAHNFTRNRGGLARKVVRLKIRPHQWCM